MGVSHALSILFCTTEMLAPFVLSITSETLISSAGCFFVRKSSNNIVNVAKIPHTPQTK